MVGVGTSRTGSLKQLRLLKVSVNVLSVLVVIHEIVVGVFVVGRHMPYYVRIIMVAHGTNTFLFYRSGCVISVTRMDE
jgi:hypothetical protein